MLIDFDHATPIAGSSAQLLRCLGVTVGHAECVHTAPGWALEMLVAPRPQNPPHLVHRPVPGRLGVMEGGQRLGVAIGDDIAA